MLITSILPQEKQNVVLWTSKFRKKLTMQNLIGSKYGCLTQQKMIVATKS